MKSVLISIKPKWCELVLSRKKKVEVRKIRPKIETPFKCYIYCTQSRYPKQALFIEKGKLGGYWANGKVIGEFVCDEIFDIEPIQGGGYVMFGGEFKDTCLTEREILKYGGGDALCGWHISNLVIYDKARELTEFTKYVENCSWRLSVDEGDCKGCKGCHAMTRPPQSWCYVEKIK